MSVPLLLAAVVLSHLPALADGKFFSPVAVRENVTIPDQRALIHFTNDVERLVIETRLTGAGTNFAWVIPLPAQPVIDAATPGLFPTLEHLFRPPIRHNFTRYFIGILAGTALVCLLIHTARSGPVLLLSIFVLFLIVSLFLPTLGTAKASASMDSGRLITILDRQLVGVFETTTIASRDPEALESWLRDSGFHLPSNSVPVIADYVRDGWVFITAKVHREQSDPETVTAHPLSFTFPTARPVYPMRLTGVDNGPIDIELYVFAPWRAEARHFQVERCTRPDYLPSPEMRPYGGSWLHWTPETPNIVHPLLRRWVAGAPVATRLTATLTPDQMRDDVWLNASAFREKRNRLYSRTGALTVALNWGSGLFAFGLLVACVKFHPRSGQWMKLGRGVGLSALAGLVLAGSIYLALPTTKVRLLKSPSIDAQHILFYLAGAILDDRPRTLEEVRQELRQLLATPSQDYDGVFVAQRHGGTGWANLLSGGAIREEDSPGNFTLRERADELDFLGYDSQGAPHVLYSYPLRREP